MLLEHEEDYQVIASTQHGFLQHDPYSWCVNGADWYYLPETSSTSQRLDVSLKHWIASMQPAERERMVGYDFPPAPQSDQCRNDTGFIEWRNKYDFSAAPHLERYTARNTRIHAKNALPTIYYDAAKTQCTSGFLQHLINKKIVLIYEKVRTIFLITMRIFVIHYTAASANSFF